MKLEFPPYETVVPTPIGTRVSPRWNYSAKGYWHYISPLRSHKGYPSSFLLTTIEQVGCVVRDSCGTELSRLCGLYSFLFCSNSNLVELSSCRTNRALNFLPALLVKPFKMGVRPLVMRSRTFSSERYVPHTSRNMWKSQSSFLHLATLA